jgi:farnesyl diphosphate synthase
MSTASAPGDPFKLRAEALRTRTESALERCLPTPDRAPSRLHEAMRYACLGGGKRVRALLVYAAGDATGAAPDDLDAAACAVELIHAYSLVHDDMPAMDDDDLRRGKPTCHRAYDEATALLVGDALQSLAFEVLADSPYAARSPQRAVSMIRALAGASGSLGMAGGQAIDLDSVGRTLSLGALETMHRHKTGALIRASVRLGALAGARVDEARIERLEQFATCIGLAFQIRDDVLDIEASTETLGKRQGADAALNKPTYPALLGLDASKQRAQALCEQALAALEDFDAGADLLRGLAGFIIARGN